MGAALRHACAAAWVAHGLEPGLNDLTHPARALGSRALPRQAVFAVTDGEVYAFDGLTGRLLFEDAIGPLVRVQVDAVQSRGPLIIPSLSPHDGRLFTLNPPASDSEECCGGVPLGVREIRYHGNRTVFGRQEATVSVSPGGTHMLLEQRETEWVGYAVDDTLRVAKVGSLRTLGIPDAATLRRSLALPDSGGALLLLGITRQTAQAVLFDLGEQRWQTLWNVSKAFPTILGDEALPAQGRSGQGVSQDPRLPQLAVVATADGQVYAFDPSEPQSLGPCHEATRKWSVALPDRKPPLAVFGIVPSERRVDTLLDFSEDLIVLCRKGSEGPTAPRSSTPASTPVVDEHPPEEARADGGSKCQGVAMRRHQRDPPEARERPGDSQNGTTNVFVLQSHPGRLLAMVDPEVHLVASQCASSTAALQQDDTTETDDKPHHDAEDSTVSSAVTYGNTVLWDPAYRPMLLTLSSSPHTAEAFQTALTPASAHGSSHGSCLLGLHSLVEGETLPHSLPEPQSPSLKAPSDGFSDGVTSNAARTSTFLGGSAALRIAGWFAGWFAPHRWVVRDRHGAQALAPSNCAAVRRLPGEDCAVCDHSMRSPVCLRGLRGAHRALWARGVSVPSLPDACAGHRSHI